MTREEKLLILDNAIDHAYVAMSKVTFETVASTGTADLIKALCELEYRYNSLAWELAELEKKKASESAPVEAKTPQTPPPAPVASAPPKESEAPAAEEESTYTMVEVRAALAKARSNGINVAEIIRSFGVDSFPQIPASRYGEVMERLGVKAE